MSVIGMSAKIRISPIGFVILGLCGLAIIYYFTTDFGFSSKYSDSGDTVSIKQLLATAIDLAQNGGDAVRAVKQSNNLKQKSKGKTEEGADDPLTQGDILSHRAIFYGFENSFPNIKVVSEEHDNASFNTVHIKPPTTSAVMLNKHLYNLEDEYVPSSSVLIWIDPLDATKEYTENLLNYVTTMVCIVVNGNPVAGVIHSPFLENTSWGWANHGHSPDLKRPSSKVSEKEPKIIISRSHAGGQINVSIKKAFGPNVHITNAGGAGYKVLALFGGVADAYVHKTLIKKWDICAGDAILRAMGGKMTTLSGKSINYGNARDYKNEGGLLATLQKHKMFLKKLS